MSGTVVDGGANQGGHSRRAGTAAVRGLTLGSAVWLALLAAPGLAQTTRTWDGGGVTSGTGVWQTIPTPQGATNWVGDVLPTSTETAVFASGTPGVTITDAVLPPFTTQFPTVSVGGIRFTSGAAAYTFNNNAFLFANGGGITVDSGVTTDQTFAGAVFNSPGIRLGQSSTGTLRNDGTGLLAIDVGYTSNIAEGGGGIGLVFDGSGNIRIGSIRDRFDSVTTSVTKNGSGTTTITAGAAAAPVGSTTGWYQGTTTLNAGQININAATAIGGGSLVINGGTLGNTSGAAVTLSTNNAQTWAADFAFAGSDNLNLGTGGVTLGSAARTVTVSLNVLTVGGVISGSGGLTKAGAGTLTVNAANLYSGTTSISGGTLALGSSGSFANSPAISVAAGATLDLTSKTAGFTFGSVQTLGGLGSVALPTSGTVSLQGFLAPGGVSAGTLAFTNAGTFDIESAITSGTGRLQFGLGPTGASDRVNVSGGTLAIGEGFLNFDDFAFTDLGGFGPGTYTLFSAAAISGTLGTTTSGTIGGFDSSLAVTGGDIQLVVVPEPQGLFFAGLGVAAAAWAGRRRRS